MHTLLRTVFEGTSSSSSWWSVEGSNRCNCCQTLVPGLQSRHKGQSTWTELRSLFDFYFLCVFRDWERRCRRETVIASFRKFMLSLQHPEWGVNTHSSCKEDLHVSKISPPTSGGSHPGILPSLVICQLSKPRCFCHELELQWLSKV